MEFTRKISATAKPTSDRGIVPNRYLSYGPLFSVLILITLCCAWLYMKFTLPLYAITARILIHEQDNSADNNKEQPLTSILPKKTLENEKEVIQSAPMLQQVVKNTRLYAPVAEDQFPDGKPAYHSSPVLLLALNPQSIRKKTRLDFGYRNRHVQIGRQQYPLNQWLKTPYGVLQFRQNPHLRSNADTRPLYFTLIPPKQAAAALGRRIKVAEANKLSTILQISLTDEVPQRGEEILNELLKVYNSSMTAERKKIAANTIAFIDRRLATVGNQLSGIESELEQYRAETGAVDVTTQERLYLENVSSNSQKAGELSMQLSVLDQIERYVRSGEVGAGLAPSTVGLNDSQLADMVKDMYNLQMNAEGLRKNTGENNPVFVAYQDQIEKVKAQILQNIESQRSSLSASKSNLSATTGSYSSALKLMPGTERQLLAITRQQQIKNNIYTYLLQKKEEISLLYLADGAGSKIVNPAQASLVPVSPNVRLVYLAALLGGGILGVVIINAKGGLQTRVVSRQDIGLLTGLPVVGELAAGKPRQYIVMGTPQRTLIAEQFRGLRTTLRHFGVGGDKKKLMITSAIPGEGKSFVAANLALSLALTGKRVALIDLDLNNPSLHHKFDIPQRLGISDFLQAKARAREIVMQSDKSPNLFILLTGQLPESPSELLLNGKLEELLAELEERFDYLILDVPPLGPVSDANIIAPSCDATLIVVRHGFTPRAILARIDENIKLNQLPNPAIVYNHVPRQDYEKAIYGYQKNNHEIKQLN